MINWERVSQNLRCPICGDKAHIVVGSDGTEGTHSHHFPISREWALSLSAPTDEECKKMRQEAVALLKEAGLDRATLQALRELAPHWKELSRARSRPGHGDMGG